MKNSKTKTTSPNSSNNEIPNITNQQNSDERKAASKPESITIKNYEKFQHLSKSQNSFPILKSVKIHKEEKTNPTRRYENTFLPDIKENNSKSSEESKAKGKTNFSLFFHNKNLEVIRQFSDKYEMKKSSQREKESKLDANERYDKIKKFFRAKEIKKQKKKIKKENLLLYSVYPGNNIELIRRCMSHRINWREVPTDMNVNVNFVWHPLSSGMSFTDLGKTYDIQMVK